MAGGTRGRPKKKVATETKARGVKRTNAHTDDTEDKNQANKKRKCMNSAY